MSGERTQTNQSKNDTSGSSARKSFTHAPPIQTEDSTHENDLENPEHDSGVLHRSPRANGGSAGSAETSKRHTSHDNPLSFDGLPHIQRREYIAYLQRTIGNDAVGYLWRTGKLQRRLKIDPKRHQAMLAHLPKKHNALQKRKNQSNAQPKRTKSSSAPLPMEFFQIPPNLNRKYNIS